MGAALALVTAYLLGSVPFAYLVARARGVNIFAVGTGNPGAANVFRMVSKPLGVLVFLLDMGKGLGAVGLGRAWGLGEGWLIALGAMAILGHGYSCFLGFRGGTGLATAIGAGIGISPLPGVLALLSAVGVALPLLRSTGHAAGLGIGLFLLLSLLLGRGWFTTLGPVVLFALVLAQSRLAPRLARR
ncbi:putative glycerol-3-phosphate acyltransferase [bacterium HR23]|nr:putative glycerol-3-phosphate acyltransferase [bacterium HR23]